MPALKCLIVYYANDQWFGSDVEWTRSGSGSYRHITGVPIPQSKPEIEKFAEENGYKIEWRGPIPTEQPAGS